LLQQVPLTQQKLPFKITLSVTLHLMVQVILAL